MAKLTVSGLDEVIKQIDHISTLDNGRLAKTMLKEGSVPIAEEWQKVAETNHSRHYNLQGKQLANPQKGVNIVGGRKVVIK